MKKVKAIHLIAYIFIIIFVVSMVATGWFGLPVYSWSFLKQGINDLIGGGFIKGSLPELISGIIFIVVSAAIIILLVLIIVRAVKKNKKQFLPISIITLILTWIIIALIYFVYTASVGYNGTDLINDQIRGIMTLFSANEGPAAHMNAAFTLVMMAIVMSFVALEFAAYFKTLKVIECNEPEEPEIEVLTEDEMREIIREELSNFYKDHPVAAPAEPVAEEPVVIAPVVEEPVAEEPIVEEPVEEVVEEVVEEPIVEEPAEEPVEEVVEEVAVEEPVEEVVEEIVEEPAEEIVEEVAVEEVAVEEVVEEVVEEPVAEEPVEEVVEEVVEEPVVEEPVAEVVEEEPVVRQEASVAVDANNNGRISFYERILSLDQELLDDYNELKNELMSYGLKSRVSSTGDTFRLHRVTYVKMIFSGKKVKLYMKLNPADYKDTTIPFDDVSHKRSYAEIPFVFKVKSGLSLRRAKALIKEMMDKAGIAQESEPKKVKYAENLIKDIKEGRVTD